MSHNMTWTRLRVLPWDFVFEVTVEAIGLCRLERWSQHCPLTGKRGHRCKCLAAKEERGAFLIQVESMFTFIGRLGKSNQ